MASLQAHLQTVHHSASDREGQEVLTLFEESVRQPVCMPSDRGGQEVPTLVEESACVQHSQLAVCILSFRPWGVSPDPFCQHVFSIQLAGSSSNM